MAGHYPRLRLRGVPEVRVLRPGGHPRQQVLAREVFRFIFYMPHDHPDIALGVSHAIDRYMLAVSEVPGAITHAHINHSEGAPLKAARWSEVRRVLSDTRRLSLPDDFSERAQDEMEKRGFKLGILFVGGIGHRNGYELEYQARIPWRPEPEQTFMSRLTATLPIEYIEEQGPARVHQLALDMAAKLLFASGHAGLALRLYWWLPRVYDAFRLEALRYPGIDLREAWGHEDEVGLRLDGVHWLNFMGPPILSRLGGAMALGSRLRLGGTTVMQLDEERAVVSLGERPDAGDLKNGRALPSYREFARVVEPWLEPLFLQPCEAPGGEPRHTSLLLTEGEARRWWRRFLD